MDTSTISIEAVKLALDAVWLRQQVVSNNIANANAPGYQALGVEFEKNLQAELDRMSTQKNASLQNIKPQIISDNVPVAVDQQMVLLNQNQLQYQALLKMLGGQAELKRIAINEGRQ